MKVAVITRTKNRGVLLRRALVSVARQSYKDYEHLIVNDGGDRAQVEQALGVLAKEDQNKVRVIHNEKSLGMEAASNCGVRATEAPLIVLLDDDDSWQDEFLKRTVEVLQQQPSLMGVVTRSCLVLERLCSDQAKCTHVSPLNPELQSMKLAALAAENLFAVNAFVYRREAYETLEPYPEDMPVQGDWLFNLKFLARYEVGVIPEYLANYHQRVGVASHLGNTVRQSVPLHVSERVRAMNKLLRADLAAGRFGLGVLVSMAEYSAVKEDRSFCLRVRRRVRVNTLWGWIARSLGLPGYSPSPSQLTRRLSSVER